MSLFHVYLQYVNACLGQCLNSVLNVKALVGTFNQEKALVGAFFVIEKSLLTERVPQRGGRQQPRRVRVVLDIVGGLTEII